MKGDSQVVLNPVVAATLKDNEPWLSQVYRHAASFSGPACMHAQSARPLRLLPPHAHPSAGTVAPLSRSVGLLVVFAVVGNERRAGGMLLSSLRG